MSAATVRSSHSVGEKNMGAKSVVLSIAAGLLVAAYLARPMRADEAAGAAAANASVDPIEWNKPLRAAEFREVLKGDDYKLPFEKAAAAIDVHAMEKDNQPVAGMRILAVSPGTPAEKIGLKVGDMVTRLHGAQVWDVLRRSPDQPQTMTYVTKDGTSHDAQIQPGLVGFNTRFQWQPEFEYLRGKARGAKWDKQTLVGILLRNTNPDLAETALHHAVADGLTPDSLIDGVGAEIALEQGRNDVALDFVWGALVENHADLKMQVNPTVLYRVAIANYKLDVAAEVLHDYDGAMSAEPEMLRRLAKMHRARAETERFQPPPSQQVVELRRFNLAPVLEPANEWTAKDFKDFLKDRESFTLSLPSSYFNFLSYKAKPPVRDMEAVLKMAIHPTDNNKSDYGRIVEIWLADQAMNRDGSKFIGDAREPMQLYIAFGSELNNVFQPITISHSGISGANFTFEDPLVQLDGKQVIEVRLLRIGGQGEIFINGRRMLHAPIDPTVADLGFAMKIVGMTVDVKDFHVCKLVPKATVQQAADGGILLKAADANLHGDRIRYEMGDDKNCIGYWDNQSDWVDWDVRTDKPGKFDVELSSSCPKDLAGCKYVVATGSGKTEQVTGEVKGTGEWTVFQPQKLGTIEIVKPGRTCVSVKVTSKPGSHVMNLRQIDLRPAK